MSAHPALPLALPEGNADAEVNADTGIDAEHADVVVESIGEELCNEPLTACCKCVRLQ